MDAAYVLGRAGTASLQAYGGRLAIAPGSDIVQDDDVGPVVTEVVHVEEPVAFHAQQLVKTDVPLEHALVALFEIEVRQEPCAAPAELLRAGLETVQVTVEPSHGFLEDGMELLEREVAADVEVPPDRRLSVVELERDAKRGDLARR